MTFLNKFYKFDLKHSKLKLLNLLKFLSSWIKIMKFNLLNVKNHVEIPIF